MISFRYNSASIAPISSIARKLILLYVSLQTLTLKCKASQRCCMFFLEIIALDISSSYSVLLLDRSGTRALTSLILMFVYLTSRILRFLWFSSACANYSIFGSSSSRSTKWSSSNALILLRLPISFFMTFEFIIGCYYSSMQSSMCKIWSRVILCC